jgi:transcription antitermination factor NusG
VIAGAGVQPSSAQTNPVVEWHAPGLPWYALRVRSRWEKCVSAALRQKGYDEFLPLYRRHSRWSDRVKEVALPLFPGYVFCRFDTARRLPVLITPGIVSVLGAGGMPVPVDPTELDAIQALMKSGLPAAPWPFLKVGQRVRIDYGAMEGVEGVLWAIKNDFRVVLSVSLLQRSVAVEIDRDWLLPIAG